MTEDAQTAGIEDVTRKLIREKLYSVLQMTYRKVRPKPILANSDKNRILRQKLAEVLISLYESKQEIWHLDESALQSLDNRSRGWFNKSETGNYTSKKLQKRLALSGATSSRGRIVWSAHT